MSGGETRTPSAMAGFLIGLAEGIGDIFDTANDGLHPYGLPGRPTWTDADYKIFEGRKHVGTLLYEARKRKYLALRATGERCWYKFTERGKLYVLKQKLLSCRDQLPDGYYCVVMFDIPEVLRCIRDRFRRLLRNAGFEQHQLSVWRCKKNVVPLINSFVESTGISRFVHATVTIDTSPLV